MNSDDIKRYEFDEDRRILHIYYLEKRILKTQRDVEKEFSELADYLHHLCHDGKVYIVVDMSNLIIDIEAAELFSDKIKKIKEAYVFPGGIARYGFQITRIMVKKAYKEYIGENPNIFNSQEEAFDYIESLRNAHPKQRVV